MYIILDMHIRHFCDVYRTSPTSSHTIYSSTQQPAGEVSVDPHKVGKLV